MTQRSIEAVIDSMSVGDVVQITSSFRGVSSVFEGRVQSKQTVREERRVTFEGGRQILRYSDTDGKSAEPIYQFGGVIEDIRVL